MSMKQHIAHIISVKFPFCVLRVISSFSCIRHLCDAHTILVFPTDLVGILQPPAPPVNPFLKKP